MLLNLYVKNFALIDEADVSFGEGLDILTGETGAGKSILIDAVGVGLGAKTSRNFIRSGQEYAWVELVFSVDSEKLAKRLEACGTPPDEDGLLIVSRKILESRSLNKINDMTVTLAKLKEATALLIDIHGQHEHQSLFHKAKHLEILDDYCRAQIGPVKQKLGERYRVYLNMKKELAEYQMDEKARQRELDFIRFEIEEIRGANIKDGEEEELAARHRKMLHARKIAEELGSVADILGTDRYDSAGEQLSRAVKQLKAASEYDEALFGMSGQMEEIENLASDLLRDVTGYLEELTFEEDEFTEVEERLNRVRGIQAKYGRDYEAVCEALALREEKERKLIHYEERRRELTKELEEVIDELEELCGQLSHVRKTESFKLAESIRNALVDLNFLDVQFTMAFTKLEHYTANGYDEAEFLISTNVGEEVRPLGQVASGGELSRIMLAVKAVLADSDEIPTLIFDEIDSGISGRTAQKVSEKLAYIAKHHQVLCITHLPQIAAMADCHYRIQKKAEGGKTKTKIEKLKQEETIEELARLLGGVSITGAVLDNAREMKALAKTVKYQQDFR
ncbi:MAG: DNA repair protein RecN [Lachnospiraceae bacterium]|nr:DNA repair protein RecN [Lachnospiraceae bacterium]